VEQSLHKTLLEINTSLATFEKLAGIVVVKDSWTVENGILTPTMKIKRNILNERYQNQLPIWLQQRKPIIWEDQ
jgi:long-subunit acyl-CoA synthetase (AMP-forming)